jgi:biopolymer transport protein ExbB/biopolymer transport protein TolQ
VQAQTISTSPLDILQTIGGFGWGILTVLLIMSVLSIGIMVNRYRYFQRAKKQSAEFADKTRALMIQGRIDDALNESTHYSHSHLARIYAAVIGDYISMREHGRDALENTMRRAADRETVDVVQELKRGLSGLASIGATAPFVGLFGTVIGIMNAFFGMAKAGTGGFAAVAGGTAEALVNTAFGLFVALPAVWAFNYFLSRVERFSVEMSNTGSELVDYFLKRDLVRTGERDIVRAAGER